MKYLLFVLCILCFVSCTPKYKAGECAYISIHPGEKWEEKMPIKIIEVGVNEYRYRFFGCDSFLCDSTSDKIDVIDYAYKPIECPE